MTWKKTNLSESADLTSCNETNGGGSIVSYSWDFGDETAGPGVTAVHRVG